MYVDLMERHRNLVRKMHSDATPSASHICEAGTLLAAMRLGMLIPSRETDGYDAVWGWKKVLIRVRREGEVDTGRIGPLDFTKAWDSALCVQLDKNFELQRIDEAMRKNLRENISSSEGNSCRSFSLEDFSACATRIWPKP